MSQRFFRSALAVLLLCGTPLLAHAQDTQVATASEEAHAHFQRGTDFYNEGRLDAALAEFQRAYEVSPSYAVLYNIGRVRAELGQPVEASRAFAQYLAEGGSAIPAARRQEVDALLATQRARVGRLRIESNVDGSTVSVDGADVATTPLAEAIEVGAGHHTVGVRAPGYEAVTIAVDLAGSVEQPVVVELRPAVVPRGSLRVRSTLTGVAVTVDGVEVGRTPLDATIPVSAGDHEIVGTRVGYWPDTHRVTVDDGAEVEVRLRLELDPAPPAEAIGTLALELPPARAAVRVDGEDRSVIGDLTLPIGEHTLEIEVEDRARWSGTVSIELRVVLAPPLTWTPAARHDRLAGAARATEAGLATAITGGALLAAGLAVLIWNETEIAATDARVLTLGHEFQAMGCPPLTSRCQEIADELHGLTPRQNDENIIRGVTAAVSAVGGLLAIVGVSLVLTAPSSDAIDAAAHAELRVGPSGVELVGSF
jgi:hypothetical protein